MILSRHTDKPVRVQWTLQEDLAWSSVSPGALQVTKFTIGVAPGKIINPRRLERCMKSGAVMGLSEALKEQVTFDQSKVTSTNWSSY